MAKVIPAAGAISEVKPKNGQFFELKELQKIVGGYIEVVDLGNEQLMVVNEEGKINGLPYNYMATQIYRRSTSVLDYIAGDVLVCDNHEIK